MAKNEWWRGSVTYQIYPRSFMDSDGDGVGDLPGITQRLPHIASLGVDAIWISPVFKSPMKDMGYDVSDYTDIDPSFGTLGDFDAFVARAHALGLKVIIDQVISHSSDEHPYFKESRKSRDNSKADWYVWADPNLDGTPPNNWQAIFGGGAWEWDAGRRQYYFHNFLREQPDWNFHNPEVQDHLLGTMKFWLDRGVDGFRLDTVNFYFHDRLLRDNPANYLEWSQDAVKPYDMQYCLYSKNQPENLTFLERIRALLDQYDARATVGEVGDAHHAIEMMGEYTSGKRLNMAYSFDMLGPDFSAEHFRSRIKNFFDKAPDGWPCWAFSNHDVPRHVGRWMPHAKDQDDLARQAAAMLLSFEGSVCLYQGEELGQVDTLLEFEELTDPQGINFWPEATGRDGCRTPMVWDAGQPHGGFSIAEKTWLPVKNPQLIRAVSAQETEGSVLSFYREMLALRKDSADLKLGKQVFLDLPEPLLGYMRGDNTLCLFNLSAASVTCELPANIAPVLQQSLSLKGNSVTLGANGFVIGTHSGV
ncbi:alpha-glucosidase [Epibacterium ulvae]|uniref:Alpha-glucosidase n=1 Tax=Epibacterium ulvae TaxID=1156985 RepID=A0A1G5RF65_9RHOB|nr:alpha-amylase family glycosyl hydrolase [Epibacterium ulvae]SCZ72703.1 alpha-glucosidase [Epibacterium ulvae]